MARERIDNAAEAKKLARTDHPKHVPHVSLDDHVGPRPVHQVSGTAINGIDVDLGKLAETEARLGTLQEKLLDHLRTAATLAGPLADGSSPVTGPMRQAFHDLAGDGGVRRVLGDYATELGRVRVAIRQTLAGYQAVDTDAAALLANPELEV